MVREEPVAAATPQRPGDHQRRGEALGSGITLRSSHAHRRHPPIRGEEEEEEEEGAEREREREREREGPPVPPHRLSLLDGPV